MNGKMDYLASNIDKRINPESLFPGAKSVIVTGLGYYTRRKQGGNGVPILSRYAYGENYHDVIKKKLSKLLEYIKSIVPDAEGRSFVDSAPVLEKAWAREAGLGWPGRHSILINRDLGSFFFIGVIILNVELDYDKPFESDNCGSCRICIEECPTGAINSNKTIDARKCIAYQTVESNEPLPDRVIRTLGGRVFGCDKCQEVCPWNRDAVTHHVPEFEISPELASLSREEWLEMLPASFNYLFRKSAIKRAKYDRFMRNIIAAAGEK